MAHNKFLRYNGDIVHARNMFDASTAYPPANTAVILADTTYPSIGNFNVPKLKVRQVHVYVYLPEGDVENFHHTRRYGNLVCFSD